MVENRISSERDSPYPLTVRVLLSHFCFNIKFLTEMEATTFFPIFFNSVADPDIGSDPHRFIP